MAKRWKELDNDRWQLTVAPDGGGPSSIFYGTREEILDKLADSQANAIARVEEMRRLPNGNGRSPAAAIQPMTPGERMQTVADLANPAKVEEGVKRVLESVIGPVDAFKQERLVKVQEAAALAFYEEMAPRGWYPSERNKRLLYGHMLAQGLDMAQVDDWKRAYADLVQGQLLEEAPAEASNLDEVEDGLHRRNAEKPTPVKTPTRYSTGIRQSDISGSPPTPTKRLKYAREQIDNMSAATYKQLMLSDPEFSRCVEFYAKPARRRIAV